LPSKYETASDEAVPIARSIIARELIGKYKLKETEVAGYLDVAQAAISKYVRKKYSRKLNRRISEIEAEIESHRKQIDFYIEKISEGKKEYVGVCICTLCNAINGFPCKFSKAGDAARGATAAV
jgi:predicted transcriptional regulator